MSGIFSVGITPRHLMRAVRCTAALVVIHAAVTYAEPRDDVPRDSLSHYLVASWTRDQGVPPGRIRALAQDGDGYLWIGSDGGLVRFDGFEFVPWNRPNSEAPRVRS